MSDMDFEQDSDKKELQEIADSLDISSVINQAAKKFEKSTHLTPVFLDRTSFAANAVSTMSLELDRILGGGVPPGRIVGISGPEHSGKSLIATNIAASQLKQNRACCYLDAEGGNDPLFLAARGIDFDAYRGRRDKNGKLLPKERDTVFYYQPETGEQVMHYMHGVMSALPENRGGDKHPSIVFMLDSVVALISDALSENLDGNRMALHAKMYSEILPIIQSQLSRTGCSFVYTNQVRQKPGVQYGCLHGDNLIRLVDDRVFTIKEIVDKKIEGEVWSHEGGRLLPRRIKNWFNNGMSQPDDWMTIYTDGPGSGNDQYSVTVTKGHKILSADGWKEAQNIVVGEMVYTKHEQKFNHGSTILELPVKVTKMAYGLSKMAARVLDKYDLEVEGSHNYLAGHSTGGIVVHNSPDYEPAGSALQFFSAIRMRLSSSKPKVNDDDHPFLNPDFIAGVKPKQGGVWEEPHINDDGSVGGLDRYIYTAIRTIKNKVYNPQKVCWMRIQFDSAGSTGRGLDPVFDAFSFLLNTGSIEKAQRQLPSSRAKEMVYKLVDNGYKLEELGVPKEFNYLEWKLFVLKNPQITDQLRQKMIVEGSVLGGGSSEDPS